LKFIDIVLLVFIVMGVKNFKITNLLIFYYLYGIYIYIYIYMIILINHYRIFKFYLRFFVTIIVSL
ncbi:MAG: hypothetical protein N7Q72_03175, partial [Spiroplasma sp. Tabriz.8]|nr:hypothetical protein [Spiroplasma sp. Tabriz.8]